MNSTHCYCLAAPLEVGEKWQSSVVQPFQRSPMCTVLHKNAVLNDLVQPQNAYENVLEIVDVYVRISSCVA